MWNSKKYAALAIVGAGFAVAAATPASAYCGGNYGAAYTTATPVYGAAYTATPVYASAGGCGTYGSAAVTSYAWPYASYGYADYPAYGSAGCGGSYGYATSGGCGSVAYYGANDFSYGYVPTTGAGCSYGYAPAINSGCGYAPSYGAAYGFVPRRGPVYGYAPTCRHNNGHAIASYRVHRGHVYASACKGKVAHRINNLKLTNND